MSINKVILIGNVAKKPEIRQTQDGKEIATFSLATSESWKDKSSGEKKDKTEWHKIVSYDYRIDFIKNYVDKGSKLYLEGALQTRKWKDKDGVEKYTTEIILKGFGCNIQLLNKKEDSQDKKEKANDSVNYADEMEDDEIPF